MTIDNILDVVTEFTNRLQLPESKYSFIVTSNSDVVELVINVEDEVRSSLKIINGSISVLYMDDYKADQYVSMDFQTPITLLYYLCIMFYTCVADVAQIDFNEILSVVLMEDVYDWRTLLFGLCENLNIPAKIKDDYVDIQDFEIHYSGFINQIRLGDNEITLEDTNYTTIVEAMFKCVEYVANIMDLADDLFKVEEEEEIEEEPDNVSEGGGMPSDMDVDVDMDMGGEGGGEEPAPVEPMENETFEEPQEAVVTMDDLL